MLLFLWKAKEWTEEIAIEATTQAEKKGEITVFDNLILLCILLERCLLIDEENIGILPFMNYLITLTSSVVFRLSCWLSSDFSKKMKGYLPTSPSETVVPIYQPTHWFQPTYPLGLIPTLSQQKPETGQPMNKKQNLESDYISNNR